MLIMEATSFTCSLQLVTSATLSKDKLQIELRDGCMHRNNNNIDKWLQYVTLSL